MISKEQILLEGIVGSKAYGLDTADSDKDMHGIFISSTEDILSLYSQNETIHKTTSKADYTYQELGKFVRLCLKCNPTLLEMLWLEDYTIKTKIGQELIDMRTWFLSTSYVSDAYGGYAISQAKRLERRGNDFASSLKKRYSKHARHCFRLLEQGAQLLSTGTMSVKVKDPQRIMEIGELPPAELISLFEKEYANYLKIASKSILPDEPRFTEISDWLVEVRVANLLEEK